MPDGAWAGALSAKLQRLSHGADGETPPASYGAPATAVDDAARLEAYAAELEGK
jgi:hypothetical protein